MSDDDQKLSIYLRKLQLLTNDKQLAEDIRPFAEKGMVDAQYAMGLIYAEGRGVPEDLARSHYWLSLAVDQGDKDADLLRNIVGSKMTEDEYQASVRMRQQVRLTVV